MRTRYCDYSLIVKAVKVRRFMDRAIRNFIDEEKADLLADAKKIQASAELFPEPVQRAMDQLIANITNENWDKAQNNCVTIAESNGPQFEKLRSQAAGLALQIAELADFEKKEIAEQKRLAAEQKAKLKAEKEAAKRAKEEEKARKAEEKARKAEEKARLKAEKEAAKKAKEEEKARKAEEKARKAEEKAKQKAAKPAKRGKDSSPFAKRDRLLKAIDRALRA